MVKDCSRVAFPVLFDMTLYVGRFDAIISVLLRIISKFLYDFKTSPTTQYHQILSQFILIRNSRAADREMIDPFSITAACTCFVTSLAGPLITKLFNPGIYLIYAQIFASGSFIGISILHFIPQAVVSLGRKSGSGYPMYSLILVIVFCLYALAELNGMRHAAAGTSPAAIGGETGKDYTIFLMHHFTAVPSLSPGRGPCLLSRTLDHYWSCNLIPARESPGNHHSAAHCCVARETRRGFHTRTPA
jgi:hypothetical protein